MPLTKSGKKVLSNMKSEYGSKKGEQVFYASMNKGNLDKSKMERTTAKAEKPKTTSTVMDQSGKKVKVKTISGK